MAQQDPPRKKPIKIGGASPPTEAPPPQEPRQVPMSLSGFVENVAKNAKAIAGGVVDAMTQSAKSTAYILKNAEWLPEVQKHPEFLGQELKNTGSGLVKAIVDPYRKHGIRVAYEEPLTVVADAMSLLSGGGGLAAKGGKLMGLSKLEKAGKALEAIPGKLAQGIADKTVQAVSLGSVNPASRRALLLLEREERTIGELTKKQLNKVLDEKFKGFTDADKALLDKLAVEGGNAAELAANPKVKAALEAYDGIVKEIRQKQLGEEGRRLLTTEQMEDAVAKKYANRKYGSTHGDALKQAKDDISRMEVKPVYTPAIGEGKKVGIMDLIWGPDEIRLGKVGFLEKFKGGKFSQDPIAYMRKAVDDFVDTETRLRFMDRVIQDPKLTKASFKGQSALGPVIPEGIFKRYWDDRGRAQAIGVRDTRLKHGVAEAEKLLLSDPVTQKYVKAIAAVGATDPTVANYLKWTFTRASGRLGAFLRVYDKILGVFKTSATVMNPRYYTGNLVGDAILTTMAGEYGLHWRTAKRLMDSLPPELRAGGRAIISENPMLAKFQKVSDIAQAADDLARAGIWTKDVARKFKEVGGSFAAAEQTFDDFFKAVGGSVEDLSNLQMKSQLLDEKIALQSQEILKLNRELDIQRERAVSTANKINAAKERASRRSPASQPSAVEAGEVAGDAAFVAKRIEGEISKIEEYARKVKEDLAKKAADYSTVKQQAALAESRLAASSKKVDSLYKKMQAQEDKAADAANALNRAKESGSDISGLEQKVIKENDLSLDAQTAWADEVSKRNKLIIARDSAKPMLASAEKAYLEVESLRKGAEKRGASLRQMLADSGKKAPPPRAAQGPPQQKPPSNRDAEYIGRLEAQYIRQNNVAIDTEAARDAMVAAARDQMKKSGEYYRQIPEAQKYAEVARQATDRANAFLGDYFGLGPIERAVFRRVVPFYSFTKAMTKLAFTYPFIAPKSAFFWHRYSQSLADMAGDADLPDEMAGYFPVGGYENGDTMWIRLAGLGPMGGVRTGRMGDAPIPSIVQFWAQNPIVRLGYRWAGGADDFYWAGKPKPGQVFVEAGRGKITRFRKDGTLETVIPQMGWMEGLSEFFPTVQVVNRLISNYNTYQGAVQNPDGTLKYPMSAGRRVLGTLGVGTKEGSREEFIQKERNRVLGIFKDLERQYPRLGPEEREYVRGLFEDYRNGYFRKIKGNN